VLASDPDADRLGADVRGGDGSWTHLTGNQIATILGYYLMLDPDGPRRRGLVVATAVTTRSLRRIVELSPGSVLIGDLLVGFKYIGAVLSELERTGSYRGTRADPSQLVIAAEESYGFLATPAIRDKDATSAAVYLAALHCRLAAEGRTMLDYFHGVLEQIGAFAENNRSIILLGEAGAREIASLMESLREDPPPAFGDAPVVEVTDYWDTDTFGPVISATDRQSRNVVSFRTADFTVTVRPSGTEPKLKFYLQAEPAPSFSKLRGAELVRAAESRAAELAEGVYRALLSRLGVGLSDAALALPDVLSLEQKLSFDSEVVPPLRERLHAGPVDPDEIGAWLSEACAAMTPGSSPLPALRAPLARQLGEWRAELGEEDLAALQAWVDRL
jgi:phosphomannomutase